MKKVSKKIVVGVAALVISIAVATGSTFAWFTTNRDADIDKFEATATTGEQNLSIAANAAGQYGRDKVAFRTFVDLTKVPVQKAASKESEYLDVINDKVGDAVDALANPTGVSGTILSGLTMPEETGDKIALKPIVADKLNTVTYGAESKYDVLVDKTGVINSDTTQNVYHPFIEFVLHFKGDREMSVYLRKTSKIEPVGANPVATPIQAIEYKAADTYGTHNAIGIGDKVVARAANAARVAFIPVSGTWNTENNQFTGPESFPDATSGIKVWCPNEAKFSGAQFDGTGAERTTTALGFYKGNFAADYYNAFMRTSKEITAKAYSNYLCALGEESGNVHAKLVDLTSSNNFTATFVVRIWLEGTDGDCFNTILQDKLNITLQFTNDVTKDAA